VTPQSTSEAKGIEERDRGESEGIEEKAELKVRINGENYAQQAVSCKTKKKKNSMHLWSK
jgi:hypothetical protein